MCQLQSYENLSLDKARLAAKLNSCLRELSIYYLDLKVIFRAPEMLNVSLKK